jgi:hypothetical protein
MRHQARAGESGQPGGASVQLHMSVGGLPSAACDTVVRPDGRRWLGRPEEGERPWVGRLGPGWAVS